MNHNLTMREIMRSEMHPDVYGGPNCDEIVPGWHGSAEGDMDGDGYIGDVLHLDAKTFPPGTRIIISIPECPQCQEDVECCCCDLTGICG